MHRGRMIQNAPSVLLPIDLPVSLRLLKCRRAPAVGATCWRESAGTAMGTLGKFGHTRPSSPRQSVTGHRRTWPRRVRAYRGALPKLLGDFARDQSAATAIEYGLIAAGIAVAAISVIKGLGSNVKSVFSTVSSSVK